MSLCVMLTLSSDVSWKTSTLYTHSMSAKRADSRDLPVCHIMQEHLPSVGQFSSSEPSKQSPIPSHCKFLGTHRPKKLRRHWNSFSSHGSKRIKHFLETLLLQWNLVNINTRGASEKVKRNLIISVASYMAIIMPGNFN